MAVKPGILCKLEKGKLLDSQERFVDTFNWMVDLLDSLTKGNAKIVEANILLGAKYSTDTHKFTVSTRKARVIVLDTKATDSTVFEAVAHSSED